MKLIKIKHRNEICLFYDCPVRTKRTYFIVEMSEKEYLEVQNFMEQKK
jgi:hypothetical protein